MQSYIGTPGSLYLNRWLFSAANEDTGQNMHHKDSQQTVATKWDYTHSDYIDYRYS